jgi:cytochrome c peroxidase
VLALAPGAVVARKVERIALHGEMRGQFKTPALRNVAETPPYMHGGHFDTLEQVVHFYSDVNEAPHPPVGQRDDLLLPLLLHHHEQADLVAFLRALSGPPLSPQLLRAPENP